MKLLVNDNQYVEAGTPLVEIDPRDYEVAVSRAKAAYQDALATAESLQVNVPITNVNTGSQVSNAQADVEGGRAGVAVARQQLEATRAQLEQAIANDIKAQNDVGRYKQLVDKQEISHQQYDQAVAAARSNAAGVAAARASVAATEQQVAQAQAKVLQAEAGLRAAGTAPQQMASARSRAQAAQAQAQQKKAELEQALLNLQYTRLAAPVNGIVSNRTVEVGQNVQIGQELMKIINLDDIWVTANFKESQLRLMRPGQRATISVDAYGKKYNGHVESIAGASGALFSLLPPENATGNYVKVVQRVPVKITFDPGETKRAHSAAGNVGRTEGLGEMSSAALTADGAALPRPVVNPWVIALAVTLATFMEVLDTSIANVSLPHIAGSLSAGTDESTWVLTSYLVSNAIVLPLSGWISSIVGRKRFYMSCVAIFTVSSLLCGLAPNLGMLIFFRILQGAGGGGLHPASRRSWPTPSPLQTRHGLRRLRSGGCAGAGHWSDSRRLDYRQFHLALDFFAEYSRRDSLPRTDLAPYSGPAPHEAAEAFRNENRLHRPRPGGFGFGHAADCPG